MLRPLFCRTLFVFVLWIAKTGGAAAQEEGLFARFETSHGSFRARLAFDRVPLTVAHFTGLIEGLQAWVDPRDGRVRRDPFYDGILFHRVVPGFVIQAGSPSGLGNDGPGYTIPDEFLPELRHDRAGILSMANSGPNTNGSQFFLTLDAAPWLDDVHSVFGEIVEGLDVIQTIGEVSTDSAGRPDEDIVILSLRTERIGEAAKAFDPADFALPQCANLDPDPKPAEETFPLLFERRELCAHSLFFSTNLTSWSSHRLSFQMPGADPPAVNALPLTTGHPSGYFRCAEILYAAPVYPPGSVGSHILTLRTAGGQRIVYAFNESGMGGSARAGQGNPGPITSVDYRPETPSRASLTVFSSSVVPLRLTLGFDSDDEGRFSGAVLTTGSGIQGTFSIAADEP